MESSEVINHSLISWIEQNLPYESTILELGSGEGTKILTQKWKVISVEHDHKWLNLAPSRYIHAPLVPHKPIDRFNSENLWYDMKILRKEIPFSYDLLLVDGPPSPNRCGIVRYHDIFNPDVPWVFDDAFRKQERRIIHSLAAKYKKSYTIHNSCGPYSPFAVL